VRGQPAPPRHRPARPLPAALARIALDETVGAFEELKRAGRIRHHRGIEWNLLPLCQRSGIPVMAYSPIEQGRLADDPVLQGIGRRRRATATQVALAWVVSHPGVCAIPEAGTPQHVRQNAAALRVELEADDVVAIDAAFPPPARPVPLEVL
jgi:diketogulonate reductase-like aldo/keto reductase